VEGAAAAAFPADGPGSGRRSWVMEQACLAQEIGAFFQQPRLCCGRGLRFEAEQQPEGVGAYGGLSQQMGVKQAPQTIASYGAFAHLAAHHHRAAPGAWAAVAVGRGKEFGLSLEQAQHHHLSVEATPLAVEPIEGSLPPQPMPLWQRHRPCPAQTARRARPRRRRVRITRRPVWLRIRTRKPDTRLRLRLVPSRVRFVMTLASQPDTLSGTPSALSWDRSRSASCPDSPRSAPRPGPGPGR